MNETKKIGGLERFCTWTAQRAAEFDIVMLDDVANTAQLAANALGCDVAQIAKSLVFRRESTGAPLLVIACGANRVDEQCIARHIGEPILRVDATFVRQHTGYVIGGVPPFAHISPLQTLIDTDLQNFNTIWAAAGHPKSVFELPVEKLVHLTGGEIVQVYR